ncbi:MAG: asparaginase [Balneolaceae bacterium]|nr:MAG: asparaginase [Balneolaceae bacterium]
MKNILLLQTGGTIAMHPNSKGADLNPEKWGELLYREIPELNEIANLTIQKVFFEDSSDVNRHHWKLLCDTIYSQYSEYDGFVVLHGTDTMSYTASALSFAFRNLAKPIIFTGSQVPMSKIRSDARRNLVNAVELATWPVPEVAICFNDHLYRGNRSTKMSIGDFDAFTSPNFPLLAEIGIDIVLAEHILRPQGELNYRPDFDDSIHVVKLHPNLNPKLLNCIDLNLTQAIIIEAFGSGNIPVKGEYNMLPFVEKCRENGCHVIITSQAAYDAVNLDLYTSGKALKQRGALSAGKMTMEATITKTMHLLKMGFADDQFNSQFMGSLAGERD